MAIMFDHAVKYNGAYYPANTPIPEPAKTPVKAAPAKDKEMPAEKPEPARKAARSRRKGDA